MRFSYIYIRPLVIRMKIEGTEKIAKELLEKTYAGYLSTIDKNGFPYIRAVFNLRCKERFPHPAKVIEEYDKNPFTIYISTNTASIKIKQIEQNKKVSIYYALPNEVKGIQKAGGKVIRFLRAPFAGEDEHESETALDNMPLDEYDYVCDNVNMSIPDQNKDITLKLHEWGYDAWKWRTIDDLPKQENQ